MHGYDFYAVEDVVVEPVSNVIKMEEMLVYERRHYLDCHNNVVPTLIKTGVKVQMMHNEFLMLCNRSSNPKKGLVLANGVGIVDADYYGNEDNDGEIAFAFINIGNEPVEIHKGDKIGQGIFMKYYLTEDDEPVKKTRTGGFGSTGV